MEGYFQIFTIYLILFFLFRLLVKAYRSKKKSNYKYKNKRKNQYRRKTYKDTETEIKNRRKTYRDTQSEIKGKIGEQNINFELSFIKRKHKILNNLYIPTFKNFTTEIDLIYIDNTGIYIIESKNYKGYIYGSEFSEYWVQRFPNGYKQNFYNPIKQNNNHIKYLQNLLPGVPNKVFRSVIVFSNRASLNKIYVKSNSIHVLTLRNLLNFINYHKKSNLSDDDINRIYNILQPYTNVDNKIKENHIKNVKKIKSKNYLN